MGAVPSLDWPLRQRKSVGKIGLLWQSGVLSHLMHVPSSSALGRLADGANGGTALGERGPLQRSPPAVGLHAYLIRLWGSAQHIASAGIGVDMTANRVGGTATACQDNMRRRSSLLRLDESLCVDDMVPSPATVWWQRSPGSSITLLRHIPVSHETEWWNVDRSGRHISTLPPGTSAIPSRSHAIGTFFMTGAGEDCPVARAV